MAQTDIPEWTPEIEWKNRALGLGYAFLGSGSAAWFLLGMATEAFDVAISQLFGLIYHPGIDFVIFAAIGMFFLYWQKKHPKGMEDDGDAVESEAEDAD